MFFWNLLTHDLIWIAQCNSMAIKLAEAIVVPNSKIPISDPQYAITAMKKMTRLWYTDSSITSQKSCGL